MKYALIIPDGAADQPLDELDGRTPIEAARTPNMDEIARNGRIGLVRTVPDGFESGSDVAIMSLLGYDPATYHSGRAPLEAAARNIRLAPADWVFRCNLVTVMDGVMKDHSAGGISDAEATVLIRDLARAVQAPGFEFHTGVSYRNLMVCRGGDDFSMLKTVPPHEIPEQPIAPHMPSGAGSDILRSIMYQSHRMFDVHEINRARVAEGKRPATQVWIWGQGCATRMPRFVEAFGIATGCMITGVDLLRGLARLMGWDVHEVPGMTSFHDTNYVGQGHDTADMLDRHDIVVSHVESPDEASHQADVKTKIAAIEAIDEHVVGPVLRKLRTFPDWRVLVLPDHPTLISTRRHDPGDVPFCIAGSNVNDRSGLDYGEANARRSGVRLERGHELMSRFLHG